MVGDVGIIYDVWKTPYNVDGKTEEEESIEVILGKVINSNPLKLSNTVTLNSYHGSITFSAGSTTWSHGSLSATKKITVVEGEFLHRLKLELNTKNWGKDTSYDPGSTPRASSRRLAMSSPYLSSSFCARATAGR